jgi:hypothetical protein
MKRTIGLNERRQLLVNARQCLAIETAADLSDVDQGAILVHAKHERPEMQPAPAGPSEATDHCS